MSNARCCQYHAVNTMLSIPCCQYHAVNTMLSIPCCQYHAVNTMLSIPCCQYHAVNTMLSIPCCQYHAVNTMLFYLFALFLVVPLYSAKYNASTFFKWSYIANFFIWMNNIILYSFSDPDVSIFMRPSYPAHAHLSSDGSHPPS